VRCGIGDLIYDEATGSLGFVVAASKSSSFNVARDIGFYVEWFDDVGQPNFEYESRISRDENKNLFVITQLPF
jgi:hypothetical protein